MTQIPSPNPWRGDNARAPCPSSLGGRPCRASASLPGQDPRQGGTAGTSSGSEIPGRGADGSRRLGWNAPAVSLQPVLQGGVGARQPPREAHGPQQKAEPGMLITAGGMGWPNPLPALGTMARWCELQQISQVFLKPRTPPPPPGEICFT